MTESMKAVPCRHAGSCWYWWLWAVELRELTGAEREPFSLSFFALWIKKKKKIHTTMIKDYRESEQKGLISSPHCFYHITALKWAFKKASQHNGAIPATSYNFILKFTLWFPLEFSQLFIACTRLGRNNHEIVFSGIPVAYSSFWPGGADLVYLLEV